MAANHPHAKCAEIFSEVHEIWFVAQPSLKRSVLTQGTIFMPSFFEGTSNSVLPY